MGLFGILKKAKKVVTADEAGATDPTSTIAQEAGSTIRAFSSKEQGTKRQQADMLSDSPLSKMIRPITILWILVLFSASLVMNWCGIATADKYEELIFWALLAVIGFYFPGRDLVKTFAKRGRK